MAQAYTYKTGVWNSILRPIKPNRMLQLLLLEACNLFEEDLNLTWIELDVNPAITGYTQNDGLIFGQHSRFQLLDTSDMLAIWVIALCKRIYSKE